NGDGKPDLYFGGSGHAGEGALAIIYGGPALFPGDPVKLENAFGDRLGLLIAGFGPDTGADFSAAFPGDMDGDGIPEIFVRQDSFADCEPSPCSGEAALFDRETLLEEGFSPAELPEIAALYQGKDSGLPDFVPLPSRGREQGNVVRLRSDVFAEGMGATACAAGDFNRDGFPDLLIGNRYFQGLDFTSNNCYVV